MNKKIIVSDLGQKDYKDTWGYQAELLEKTVLLKRENRTKEVKISTPNHFLFVEHPHVYTLGKSGDLSNLLLSESQLKEKGATFL